MSPMPEYKRVVDRYRWFAWTFVAIWGGCIAVGIIKDTYGILTTLTNPPTTSQVVNGAEETNGLSNWGGLSKLWFFIPGDENAGPFFDDVAFGNPVRDAKFDVYFKQKPNTQQPSIYPDFSEYEHNYIFANISMLTPNYTVKLESWANDEPMYGIPQIWIKANIYTYPSGSNAGSGSALIKFGTSNETGQLTHEGQFRVTAKSTHVPLYITKMLVPKQGNVFMGYEKDYGVTEHFHVEVGTPEEFNEFENDAPAPSGEKMKTLTALHGDPPSKRNEVLFQVILRTRLVSCVYPVRLYERLNTVYGKMGGWLSWCFFAFGLMFVRVQSTSSKDDPLTMRCCGRRQQSPQQTTCEPAGSLLQS